MTILSLIIFILLIILNYIIYKIFKYQKKMLWISTFFLALNFILILLIFYNNQKLGFDNGIVYGGKLGLTATDEYKYYMESEHLTYHLVNHGGFESFFNKTMDPFPFKVDEKPYGIYNPFITMLGFLKYFGIKSLVDLLTFKLIFTLINTFLIYSISKQYLNEKLSLISTILFNISPAYLLVNATLLRDNIILTGILCFIYLFSKKHSKSLSLILIISGSTILLLFRVYTLAAILFSILIIVLNKKKLFNKFDALVLITTFIGLLVLININIPIGQIQFLRDNITTNFGSGITGTFNLLFVTLKEICIRGLFLNTLPTNSIYVVLTILSGIYYIIFIPILIYKLMLVKFNKVNTNYIVIIKFTLYFTLYNALMLVSKDTFIPSRLAIMWYPLFFIIILYPLNKYDFISKFIIKKDSMQ